MNDFQDFLNLLKQRRSIRSFSDRHVGRAIIESIIEAASWAPSASNRQDWKFIVVTGNEMKSRMAQAVQQRWQSIIEGNRGRGFIEEIAKYASAFSNFATAPVVIVVACRKTDTVQRTLLGDDAAAASGSAVSASMAAQNLMLAAHAAGLGSCCQTGPLAARAELADLMELGRRMDIVCLVALGWPDEQPEPPSRKPVSEIARFI